MSGEAFGVKSMSGEYVGGAEDGAKFAGLEVKGAPLAVLLVTRQGQPMALSPAGLDDGALLDVLERALAACRSFGHRQS